ncbi:tail fiber protein [Stenotrophomonas maltophilia]|uniref:phage tail protein n=1 Tax=Stenotrophomonas maltophilia TaxID=40324 RepID=UPI001F3B3CFD|nr:phage tail protein [Stenotrophomonas maltophilia]MCF3530876.1 tail fiber protein [Stenotrophomonas maltophilia]MCF3534760.1 tail fiber protein [Stenotrophomonas maltophilia]
MTALRFKVTDKGREALVNAEQNGTAPVLVHSIGLTANTFEAHAGMESLPGEHTRLASISGGATAPDTIHITARDETTASYSVRGMGVYLQDGTLLAVYGQRETLAEKSTQAVLMLAIDLQFAEISSADLAFGDTNFDLNVGTELVAGVLELATPEETAAGEDAVRAIHPLGLRKLLDQLLGPGLDADLLDGQHGEFYLDWANMTGVPASTHIPGQVITFAGVAAPQGTLLCDGRTVLRADYPRLFAAIGLTYGNDVADDSFRLPKIDEGLGIVHTADPALVGQISAGEVIAHGHGAKSSGAGAHGHAITIGGGGGHSHGASASAVGDHAHGAWTDGQGSHTHGVGDPGHSHTWTGPNSGGGGGGWSASGISSPSPVGTSHNGTGIWIGEGGHHAHNIGMNGAGGHGHTISVAAVGDHTHSASASGVADHSHAIDVASTGGTRNLPAGVRMLYCITY